MLNSKLIALDGDGVLVDYGTAYGAAWEKAFNVKLTRVDPLAYFAPDLWGVSQLAPSELTHLKSHMDTEFWETMPALPGALQACRDLVANGYRLVCVSALPTRYAHARLKNLKALGFPISEVFATPATGLERSPKVTKLTELKPLAFVDDFIQYLSGIPASVHRALVVGPPNGNPNADPKLSHVVDSRHQSLKEFSEWWLTNN